MPQSRAKSQIAKKKYAAGTSRGPRSRATLALQMARAMEAQQRAEIGQRLRELRGVRTQQPIADYVGVTLRAYQAWEAGHSGISWAHLKKLARYFQASENYLLYGDEHGPAHRQEQLDRIETKLDELAELLSAREVADAFGAATGGTNQARDERGEEDESSESEEEAG